MIGLVIYLTLCAIKAAQIEELPAIETTAPPVSEEKRLSDFTEFFRSMSKANLGPFEAKKKELYDLCVSMKQKNDNLQKLLGDSFSKEDLTYNTYTNTLEEVMKIFNNNLNGIKKRLEVFCDSGLKSDFLSTLIFAGGTEEIGKYLDSDEFQIVAVDKKGNIVKSDSLDFTGA
jgi:hypothetical protein